MGKWVTIDPGEDTGFSIWEDNKLVVGQTIKMWNVPQLLNAVMVPYDTDDYPERFPEEANLYEILEGERLERVVVEDWRLYPWVIKAGGLDFDQCRTARVIGAITWLCQLWDVPMILQGANIKEAAVAAGAETLYYNPLHENRHINDSIQHGVFYLVVEQGQAPVDGR